MWNFHKKLMIKNLWSKVELVCTNHKEPVPLYVYNGAITPFYACPKYMKKDDEHPNGHEENERGCSNRISFEDVRHLVEKFSDQIETDIMNGEMCDYTGFKFHWKTIDAVILKYSDDKIVMGVTNRKEIGIWRD